MDANTHIEVESGDAYWYYDGDCQKRIGSCGCMPWIELAHNGDNETIYTDNMSYCDHGWYCGADSKETAEVLYSMLPQDLADEVRAEYAEYRDDQCAVDVQDYIRERNGWDYDYCYFECPKGHAKEITDEDLIDKLGLAHDPDHDECDMTEEEA